ncbi:hypothetical protein VTN77DRAFT_4434 [Rasamsonia byssochlamydoides]|uniref:uncharacterized protein n=1 Tax=Rasamsonia byssochlamydoides TaxID=89139 RepID=UPI00374365FD
MVSSWFILALVTVSCVVQAYPIRLHEEEHDHAHADAPSTGLMTRSPDPRLKDPFDIDSLLAGINDMIPTDGDISQWIDSAIRQGLHYDENNDNNKGDENFKDNDVHIVAPLNTNSSNNNNNLAPATQGNNPTSNNNNSPNDDTKNKSGDDNNKDPFGLKSLLPSLKSVFNGLNSADEVVPN